MAARRRLKMVLEERARQLDIPREILEVEHRPKAVGALPPKPVAVPPVIEPALADVVIVGQSEQLAEGVKLSMDRMLDIQRHKILTEGKVPTATDLAFLKLQATVAAIFMRTQTRVDETKLRGRVADRMGKILERLQALAPGTAAGS